MFKPLRDAHVTSPFGERTLDGTEDNHKGTDYRAPVGTPLFAMGAGLVERADDVDDSANGKNVALLDDSDGRLVYLHMSRVDVVGGQRVAAGQRIGLSGKSGAAQGPHLHLQWQPHGIGGAVADVDPVVRALPPPGADDSGGDGLVAFLVVVLLGGGAYYYLKKKRKRAA